MDPITLVLLSAMVLALGVMAWRRWGPAGPFRQTRDGRRLAQRVLRVHGAQRCMRTIELLEELAAAEDGAAIAEAWECIELPVVEALPDCPPDLTFRLLAACQAAASATANRDVAKRLMTVRNSLVR